jgi:hypothetical protein
MNYFKTQKIIFINSFFHCKKNIDILRYFLCAQQALGFLYFLIVLVLVLPGNTRCKNFG